jgi:response regulator RpfG family c-di-GMP phosphodiesterase
MAYNLFYINRINVNQNMAIKMQKTKTKKILIIEQNEFHRFFYSFVLSHYYSCPVLTVDRGEKALRVLAENSFDIIYVDISAPESKGIELLENLKYKYPDCKTPIIAITANRSRETLSRLISLGITEYIVKPEGEENIFEKLGLCFN